MKVVFTYDLHDSLVISPRALFCLDVESDIQYAHSHARVGEGGGGVLIEMYTESNQGSHYKSSNPDQPNVLKVSLAEPLVSEQSINGFPRRAIVLAWCCCSRVRS